MQETTAEIWIGPSQGGSYGGTSGGLNATWLLLLRENSRPSWLLLPGNVYDEKPPPMRTRGVWIPSHDHPIEDALVLFAVQGAQHPEITAVFKEFVKQRSSKQLNVDQIYPDGFPDVVYKTCRRLLAGWHVVVNVGEYSHAQFDSSALDEYRAIDLEVRTTSIRRAADKSTPTQ